MRTRKLIVIVLALIVAIDVVLLCAGGPDGASAANPTQSAAGEVGRPALPNAATDNTASAMNLVRIRSPRAVINELSAAGAVELISKRQVVLEVDGTIAEVAVEVGDWVAAGDLLVALNTEELAWAVTRAEVDLATAEAELAKLQQGSDPGEVVVAEANLAAARENLVKVQSGATPEELSAAEAKVAAAQAKLNGLFAPPSGGEVEEARAALEKAEIARQEALREYDKIKWRNDIGMTAEAAALQKATVDVEQAQGKFDKLNVGPTNASVQEAKSELQRAVSDLEQLKNRPSAAEIAEAQAKVSEAEQKLNKLNAGASGAELQSAEAKVSKAQLDLEEARLKLTKATITAPIEGAILEVNLTAGERGTVGKAVATIADTRQLKLNVKVAEVDIPQISLGQEATIAIDAIRNRSFTGIVEQINPINKEDKDVVNYPVTIRLTDSDLTGVRPGMNAVATFAGAESDVAQWLVPTTALQEQNGQYAVQVVRGEDVLAVPVQPQETQGEWTVVMAPQLVAGDTVVGQVASYVGQGDDVQVSY
ncbi:MAG TPA: HlyD family efflux transporter periplasmic adaptor subunit [Caldilineaceae bacterium]|nr:HlyD family efflux transporter periplasmic adaptor subunit [Caldilineaceae bacterium]